MIRLPAYTPDEQEVEALEQRAWDLGYPLIGCQTIYTLQFIARYVAEEPQGPTAANIGWALNDPQQYVDRRLKEMVERGLAACNVEWEPDSRDPQDRFGKPVARYTLTEEGYTVITLPEPAPGPRSRPSALSA